MRSFEDKGLWKIKTWFDVRAEKITLGMRVWKAFVRNA